MFRKISSFESVVKVKDFHYQETDQLTFIFFLCPKMNGRGLVINELGTGLTCRYLDQLSSSAIERIEKVNRFQKEAVNLGLSFEIIAVWSNADCLILYPVPVDKAEPPSILPEFSGRIVGTYELVKDNLERFSSFYQLQPWLTIPQRFVKSEEERLNSLLPSNVPDNLRQDFVRRVFAGFALDGLLIRKGHFGANPVILGVESPGVVVLQNAALNKDDRIPVIELR